ncbi:hypothetical protein JOM56_005296 [Amanita muscaria]
MFNTHLRLSVVTFLVLTSSLVNGASTGGVRESSLFIHHRRTKPTLLLNEFRTPGYAKRQGSNSSGLSLDDFPQQCQAGCQVAVNTLNTCSTSSCICTPAVEHSLDDCINCTVEVVPDPTVIADGQKVFDTFNALCKGTGVETLSLTAVTLTGTNTASSSFLNPFLPPSSATTTIQTTITPLGPKTTITNAGASSSLASSTVLSGSPSTTANPIISNPLAGNDAVALPRASKAYAAVGLVIAFFMCLA